MSRVFSGLVFILAWLFAVEGRAQSGVPADSLLAKELRPMQRLVLVGISRWQHFSYGHPGYECQFEPSCSHFMALAIAEHGVLAGGVVGTDRIVRCNPSARHNHLRCLAPDLNEDGRLLEPLNLPVAEHPARSPVLAAGLSLVPGLGRAYAGHYLDGVLSFVLVGSFAYAAQRHCEAENTGWAVFNGGLTLLFWSADVYGAYWSARHR
jgi:putative component of membrane protein insertase Oxa1/YidC/SpoIIIJ protein YidD